MALYVVAVLLINLFPVQGFYVALRLVACAQSGQEVSLGSLNLTVPPPKFVSHFMRNLKVLIKAKREQYYKCNHKLTLWSAGVTGLYLMTLMEGGLPVLCIFFLAEGHKQSITHYSTGFK